MARGNRSFRLSGLLINFFLTVILLTLVLFATIAPSKTTKGVYATLDKRLTVRIQHDGGTIHTITVGRASHEFKPNIIKAAIGDIVTFEFYPTNHSVVRANFDTPCVPREMMEPNATGFFSGFFPLDATSVPKNPPTWSWKVDTSEPIFFYCSGEDSCNHWGMVGAINPSAKQPLGEFITNAKQRPFQLSPGEPFPDEAVKNSTPTPTSISTPTPSSNSSVPTSSHNAVSTYAIVGISLGAVVAAVIFGVIFFFLCKRRNHKQGKLASPETAAMQGQGLFYSHDGAASGSGHIQPGVQPLMAGYYDYSRGSPVNGSYYAPQNSPFASTAYISPPMMGYAQAGSGVVDGAFPGSSTAELVGSGFSPVELAGGEGGK